jgi:hypothetical protein
MRRTALISILGLFLSAAMVFSCGGSGDGAVSDNGLQGGSSGAAGQSGTGGTAGAGGAAPSGGAAGTGGAVATGGQAGTGGTAGTGGVPAAGGAAGSGGVVQTGGQAGTGGIAGTGGTAPSGGAAGTGGTGGIGVTGGTGGPGGTGGTGGTAKDSGTDGAPPKDAGSATCPTPANRPINGDPCTDPTLICDYAATSGGPARRCNCLPAGAAAEWLCYNTSADGGVLGGGACPATKPAVGDACTDPTLGCPYFLNPPRYCTCRVSGGATTPTWGGGTC